MIFLDKFEKMDEEDLEKQMAHLGTVWNSNFQFYNTLPIW